MSVQKVPAEESNPDHMGDVYPKRASNFGIASPTRRESRRSILKNVPTVEFSETYDYVMVFPMSEKADKKKNVDYDEGEEMKQSNVAKHCMSAMVARGLEIFPYLSVQSDELYVLVRCPVSESLSVHCIYGR